MPEKDYTDYNGEAEVGKYLGGLEEQPLGVEYRWQLGHTTRADRPLIDRS